MAQGLYKKSPVKMAGALISQGVGGLMGVAGGIIGSGKRKREQRAAQREMEANKARYTNLDTSNLAANLDNAYEDLTVNTQAADFSRQQAQQNNANIMDKMSGASGGSGIAAMAQALANAGNEQAQQSSVSIGQQESANQLKAAGGAMSVQNAEIQGAQNARAAEKDKTETLLGMSQQRLGAANAARDQATASIMGGVGQMAGALGGHIDSLPPTTPV
tara:strand:+ start:5097 stop:5750 length:654 start_codon:yes stop_codon:yes gene_type:complete